MTKQLFFAPLRLCVRLIHTLNQKRHLDSGEELLTLNGHSDRVQAVALTPDGLKVISGSRDNTLKVWSLDSGNNIATFTGESPFECCAVAPDGVTIVVGERSGRVHFLRLENSNEYRT